MKWSLLHCSDSFNKKYGKASPSKLFVHGKYEGCAKVYYEILHNVLQEVGYRFDVASARCGAHIELY